MSAADPGILEHSPRGRRARARAAPQPNPSLRFFYDEFRGDLPDELRDEFKTLLEPYDAYLDAAMLTGGRVDPEELPLVVAAVDPEQLEEVVAGIDRDRFVAAATRVNDWANTEC